MIFITNRFPEQSIRTEIGRDFHFALDNNASSNSIFFCENLSKDQNKEIGSLAFLQRLKKSSYQQILIYIHGFSNLPEDAFSATRELQKLCDQKKEKEVLVVPLIWPCDNDFGLVKDYWDDQKSADQSAFSFSRVLERFSVWQRSQDESGKAPCLKRINVLAHSMGNRVFRETLVTWNKYDLADGVPMIFRNAFLVAADLVNETLHKGEKGELICHASRNVVVYHASDDLALRSSKAFNLKNKIASRRLGHTGPEDMRKTPRNVYRVDCDDVNNVYDLKGHSYFRSGTRKGRPGKVFNHIFKCLESGRVFPENEHQRSSIITKKTRKS